MIRSDPGMEAIFQFHVNLKEFFDTANVVGFVQNRFPWETYIHFDKGNLRIAPATGPYGRCSIETGQSRSAKFVTFEEAITIMESMKENK